MSDILYFAVPAFPIALARVIAPALRGRPAAVAAAGSVRALVQCASREAEAEGVFEGMPVYRARRLCPGLAMLPPDPALARRAMRRLVELAGRYTPLWEPARAGELYLDLTGSRRLLGPGRDAAMRLKREVAAALRLEAAVGVATNKLVSRIASGCLLRPGVCDVLRGSEAAFIAPLPVPVLPGVGRTREKLLLMDLNLRRVGQIAALSVAQLSLAMGSFAPLLHQRACGIDPSPVRPPQQRPGIAAEAILAREENDDAALLATLCRLTEECGLELRRRGQGTRRLTLAVTYADGATEQRSHPLPAPRSRDDVLFAAAEELFLKTCRRRVRVKALQLRCRRLAAESRQLELYAALAPAPAGRRQALQTALDRLRERHGQEAVRRAATMHRG